MAFALFMFSSSTQSQPVIATKGYVDGRIGAIANTTSAIVSREELVNRLATLAKLSDLDLVLNIDFAGSVAGNASVATAGAGAGATGGWYMAATPRSTTIRLRLVGGAEYSQNLGTLTPGRDYYVFLKRDNTVEASLNPTISDGFRIGGFHTMCCSTIGLPAGHPYQNYAAGQIMPSSVWTNNHRPLDVNGGYVYLRNVSGTDINAAESAMVADGRLASARPWVMIYPGTHVNAAGTNIPVATTGGHVRSRVPPNITNSTGFPSGSWSDDLMRRTVDLNGQRFIRDNNFAGTTTCPTAWNSIGPGQAACANTGSEFCAITEGNPSAGAQVRTGTNACTRLTGQDHACVFLNAGGFARNGVSMISNVGAWGTIGYLNWLLDRSANQTGCNATQVLMAGGDSSNPATGTGGNAARGFRNTGTPRNFSETYINVRLASPDVPDREPMRCLAGRYVNNGVCAACPANTYQPNNGFMGIACIPCPVNATCPAPGTTFTCNSGFTRVGDTCACGPGQQLNAAGTGCENCPAGTVSNTAGTDACALCAGTTVPNSGRTVCEACDTATNTGNWCANGLRNSCPIPSSPAGLTLDANASRAARTQCFATGPYTGTASTGTQTCRAQASGTIFTACTFNIISCSNAVGWYRTDNAWDNGTPSMCIPGQVCCTQCPVGLRGRIDAIGLGQCQA
ncbi:MAG: hypothetical protein FWD15_05555 [Alphaproteobacteria bacterium]|nr:hypothetical protein [Alphaproteobacteria bacterium]